MLKVCLPRWKVFMSEIWQMVRTIDTILKNGIVNRWFLPRLSIFYPSLPCDSSYVWKMTPNPSAKCCQNSPVHSICTPLMNSETVKFKPKFLLELCVRNFGFLISFIPYWGSYTLTCIYLFSLKFCTSFQKEF